MSSTVVLPAGTYPVGTRVLGPANVPVGTSEIELSLDGAAMTDPALHVAITLDLSLDSGVTWNNPHPQADPFPVGMTLDGGAKNRQGGALARYTIGTFLPDSTNPNRRVRATVVISGTPLTTSGTLSLT